MATTPKTEIHLTKGPAGKDQLAQVVYSEGAAVALEFDGWVRTPAPEPVGSPAELAESAPKSPKKP